ncbi:MAG: helicase-related protein [Sphaerochaetaceae bacterium]|nr:helicase-related protein [Sphaerochaetaceae bacterium]
MVKLEELKSGYLVKGISSEGTVNLINIEWHGNDYVTIYYKEIDGHLKEQTLGRDVEKNLEIIQPGSSWKYDSDPNLFKLASEAKRINLAYLFDPLLAVHTSKITPLPHQITAVYDNMLQRQPLRFLLADDPGAGKTIMAGLLIKELMVRGDVKRCLIVSPGGLVEQWQDELADKFHLDFEIITRDRIDTARTGNPFTELNLVIARLDQLSRDEELQLKVSAEDWDLIICDEAHKMAAHFFGNKTEKTKRYRLGEILRDHTRHFLLMTATPHNGKEEDFQLFLALIDKDRFEGKFRGGVHSVNVSDIMRRMVKEDLLKFDETKLFPERKAFTKEFNLSPDEAQLYSEVTNYVREEFNKAESKGEGKKNVVGFALTILQRRLASSPEAIYQSLKRRKERLEKRLSELYLIKEGKISEKTDPFYNLSKEDLEDYDDSPDSESEKFEERLVDQATVSETIPEFEKEIETLERLEKDAIKLRNSEKDSKWEALRDLINNKKEMFDAQGHRRKLIIFTEHRDTLVYLENRIIKLVGKPEAVVTIHGDVKREDRKVRQDKFTQDKSVSFLIATDAAGEGINLQRANLMINYDIPWNPNRIEQRFGRIHRIGQTEVCFLWNLIAADTREGDVFVTLFEKLEEQRRALDGRVFDVLGKVFREKSLKDMLLDAIRYGDDPKRKEELRQKVKGVLDLDKINEVLKQKAIGELSLTKTDIQAIREELERANARKLQPHFIAGFFIEAFKQFGGTITEREKNRYEIKYVPATIRQKDKLNQRKILTSYERVCFDKNLISAIGKPTATFLCPGNILFDTVLNLILEKYGQLLRQGTILVDTSGKLKEPALLYFLEHEIADERKISDGSNQTVSRQMNFVYLTKSGDMIDAGYAPYLDCRPTKLEEFDKRLLNEDWVKNSPKKTIVNYALMSIVPSEFKKVEMRRKEYIQKTMNAIKERLTKEIIYWDKRANELHEKELEGKSSNINSGNARRMADELQSRLDARINDLKKQDKLINKQPFVIGGALVIPENMVGEIIPTYAHNIDNRAKTEKIAMDEIILIEKKIGREPKDVSKSNYGWDIESIDIKTKDVFFIEVKGRIKGADTVTVSSNEIKTGKNVAQDNINRYILAIVEIDNDKAVNTKYVRNPFEGTEINFATTSINFDIKKLMKKAEDPQ